MATQTMRALIAKRRNEIFKSVRVKPLRGRKRLFSALPYCLLLIQAAAVIALYAFAAYMLPVFWYVCIALTACAAVAVLLSDRCAQSKASWTALMLLSCGFGIFIFLSANKTVCYGAHKKRFDKLYVRSKKYSLTETPKSCTQVVKNDCAYLFNAGGFSARTGTDIKYFGNAEVLVEDMFSQFEKANKFIFIEFFIFADGALAERLLKILGRKTAEGVEVRILCDDLGCRSVFCQSLKKRLKNSGVNIKLFSPVLSVYNFGLNFRDHRKIVVIDGKVSYVCCFNFADECVNARRMNGVYKDAGVRLDGSAVDDTTLIFLRQWDFAVKSDGCWDNYLNLYEKRDNACVVAAYAGGPDLTEPICRGAFLNAVSGAAERVYIMSPYFVPDGETFSRLKEKALSGVDVRLVLPAVPDWKFVYRLTSSCAEKLIKYGVKVYYAPRTFLHSKVVLTENCAIVGSVNVDMRSFYQQFENAVYTDDKGVMKEVTGDFNSVFALTSPAEQKRLNLFDKLINGILKLFAPLM